MPVPDPSQSSSAAAPGSSHRSPAAAVASVLEALDPEQRAVAEALTGPVCVLAGAGTGKTRAITHRIAHGVHSGVYQPSQVLAVTFTTRAAGEMRGRLRALGVGGVQARTFHSAALRQARYFWPLLHGTDLPPLVDSKIPLVAEASRRVRLSADRTLLRDIASEIEWAKVSNVAPEAYPDAAAAAGRSVAGLAPEQLARLLGAYGDVCRDSGRIDLEDVLLLACSLIADSVKVAATVRSQYRHLVVDEYQDVSPLQQRLLELWLGPSSEVCVVGDPGQTIYSFAGASPRYLLGFPERFPTAQVIRLERDYRSTPQVVDVANRVLAQARNSPRSGFGAPLRLRAQREPGPAVVFSATADEVEEAAAVAAAIKKLTTGGGAIAPRAVAVLFRINAMSAAYEAALTEVGVPYVLRGAERFFEREEVRRAVTLLRGTARSVADGTRTGPSAGLVEEVREVLAAAGWDPAKPPASGRTRERWESLAALDALAADTAAAEPGAGLAEFVVELAARADAAHAPVADGVTLSSLHSAKGLEWEAVFLVGLHEGGMPLSHADTDEQVEEERRLLYVGVTRARTHLRLSWSAARSAGGRARRNPSRFLDGIRPPDRPGAGPAPRSSRKTVRCRGCGTELTDRAQIADGRCGTCPAGYDEGLFERLRAWRTETAKAANVPRTWCSPTRHSRSWPNADRPAMPSSSASPGSGRPSSPATAPTCWRSARVRHRQLSRAPPLAEHRPAADRPRTISAPVSHRFRKCVDRSPLTGYRPDVGNASLRRQQSNSPQTVETEEVIPVVNDIKPLQGTAVSIRGAEYAGRPLAIQGAWARNQQPAFTSPALGRGCGVAPAMTAAAGVAGTTPRRVVDRAQHAVGTTVPASTDLDFRGRPRWRPV